MNLLPQLSPPPQLQAQLRVLASREAQRRRRYRSVSSLASHLAAEARLLFDNLMRPYAVPCAGGLLSTLFLFGLVAPTFAVNRNIRHDVPTAIVTPASLEFSLAFNIAESVQFDEMVVDVNIDEAGRVTSYSLPRGEKSVSDPALLRGLESTLLYTKFTPATFFGQPASGRTRITIRRNSVDVRG